MQIMATLLWGSWGSTFPYKNTSMITRGLQIREGGNGENWEGPQFDPVVRRIEPESLSSLGAREHLPMEARKKACFMLWF